ncbi:MAG TPA: hypothetical protein ENJ28_09960 [Gammaproteobacteria bacterium]|nr:hypothetical protein [Gammaproteobacteria bacterium]
MEFFQEVPNSKLDIAELKNLLTINSLTMLCDSISEVSSNSHNEADIYCLWGSFTLRRDEIKTGVRFSLLDCPHSLAWTVTLNDKHVVIHCTIDKKEEDPDFIESINEFVTDWSNGISRVLTL